MNTESILPLLSEMLAKSFAVLLAAGLVIRVWRGATAAQRHLVWFAAIVTILLLPMTRLVTPRWTVPFERTNRIRVTMPDLPMAPMVDSVASSVRAAEPPRPRRWTPPNWRKVLYEVWLGVVVFLIGYRLLGSWRLRRLERNSLPVDDARVQEMASGILREFKIDRRVRIRLSHERRVPMTWGARQPMLMLPAEALQWKDVRLLAALRHEAGHISRHDYLVRWITQLACALYWPNPLAWLAARALRVAQEQATDDLVLRAGTPPDEYAAQLLEAARSVILRGSFAGHAVAMANPSTLAGRVVAIVDDQRDRRPLSRRAVAAGSIVVMCALALCTAAQLRGDGQTPTGAPKAAGATPPSQNEPPVAGVGGPLVATEGIAAGATMGLGPIRAEDRTDDRSAKRLTLHIPIKVRPEVKVNLADLTIHVLFYDIIDGNDVVQTSANVNYHWISRPPYWTKGDTEELDVEYRLPQPKPGATRRDDRKYYGYIVRLYYKGHLQAAAAEPGQLSQQNPPPQTIPPEDPSEAAPPKSAKRGEDGQVGDLFLEAYTAIGKAEELEAQRRFKEALSGMKTGLKTLDEVTQLDPNWQPQIVAYRKDRARAAIERIAALADSQTPPSDGAVTSPPAAAAPAESAMLKKAEKIIIPKIEMRDATPAEAIDFLRVKAVELDPEKQGVTLILKPGPATDARITLSLTNVPLVEALRYVAGLSELELHVEPDALVLQPPGDGAKIKAQPAAAVTPADRSKSPVELTSDSTRMEKGVAIAEGDARLKFGATTITAQSIRYNPENRSAQCGGKVEINNGASTMRGENLAVVFGEGDVISVSGDHSVTLEPTRTGAAPSSPPGR